MDWCTILFDGLDTSDLKHMPPFPFPKELFPPGTFPEGMKFSTDFHMPPAVEELLEKVGPGNCLTRRHQPLFRPSFLY